MNNTGVEHLKKKGKMLASGKEKKRIIKKWFSTYRGRVSKDSFQSTKVGTRLEEWMPESSIWKKKRKNVTHLEKRKKGSWGNDFQLIESEFQTIPSNPLRSKCWDASWRMNLEEEVEHLKKRRKNVTHALRRKGKWIAFGEKWFSDYRISNDSKIQTLRKINARSGNYFYLEYTLRGKRKKRKEKDSVILSQLGIKEITRWLFITKNARYIRPWKKKKKKLNRETRKKETSTRDNGMES